MEDMFELDVVEITAPAQELAESADQAAAASWPYSCNSTRNSRCCI